MNNILFLVELEHFPTQKKKKKRLEKKDLIKISIKTLACVQKM